MGDRIKAFLLSPITYYLSLLLRYFNRQIFTGESEVGTFAAFHVFGCGLGESCDEDWERDGRVAVDVGSVSAARKFAEDERFISRNPHCARTPARMRRIGRHSNRVLV